MNLKLVVAATAAALIAGCNTMHGVGEDVDAAGRKVEGAMKKDKTTPTASPGTSSNPAPVTTTPAPSQNEGRASDTMSPSGARTQ